MINKKTTSYSLIIFTITAIIASVLFSFSLIYSFLISIAWAMVILHRDKADVSTLLKKSLKDTLEYKNLFVTIAFIGAIVSMWLSSGAIATMIYYGFNYIVGTNFLLFSFLIVAGCALFIGSAVGTFSTIGLILYSIGTVIDIPKEILAGAIISGAFIADKISPISGLIVINLNITATKYNRSLKYSLRTLIPAVLASCMVYYFLGKEYIILEKTSNLLEIQSQLGYAFNISPYLFLIPLIILVMSFLGFKPLQTIASGVSAGVLFSLFLQKYTLREIGKFLLFGFSLDTGNEIAELLQGGGLFNIIDVVIIVSCAILLVNILINSGVIDVIIGDFVRAIDSPRKLIHRTGILSMLLTILTCDQTVGIFLPVKILRERYDKYQIPREILFRTISDTGIVIAPLLPWNINYLIIVGIIGTGINFIPYAVFCYISPAIAMLSGFLYPGKTKHDPVLHATDLANQI